MTSRKKATVAAPAPAPSNEHEDDCGEMDGEGDVAMGDDDDGEVLPTDVDTSDDASTSDAASGGGIPGCDPPIPKPQASVVVLDETHKSDPPERIVLHDLDGSAEVYEVDPNRQSQIPDEKLPLVGTLVAKYPAPIRSSGLLVRDVWGSSRACSKVVGVFSPWFVRSTALCIRWPNGPQSAQAAVA